MVRDGPLALKVGTAMGLVGKMVPVDHHVPWVPFELLPSVPHMVFGTPVPVDSGLVLILVGDLTLDFEHDCVWDEHLHVLSGPCEVRVESAHHFFVRSVHCLARHGVAKASSVAYVVDGLLAVAETMGFPCLVPKSTP